jgi:hypothetical protein
MLATRMRMSSAVALVLPSGLIIPYDGVVAPNGWSLYTAANGKHIIGAGSTYAVDDNGAGTGSRNPTSNTKGSHLGNAGLFASTGVGGSGGWRYAGYFSAGSHTQTLASAITPITPYEQLVLIKSDEELNKIPQDGMILGIQDFSGLSVIKDNGRILKADSTITSNAGNISTGSVATNTYGNHSHQPVGLTTSPGPATKYKTAGSHSHTVTLALTYAVKRFYLSAWTNASAEFNLTNNMIGMYENTTPPDGWVLCDGDNGTPNLRDYFIQLDSAANDNQSAGDNTVNFNGTTSNDGSHNHITGGNGAQYAMYHGGNYGAHNHDFNDDKSWLPPYYALAFIMKI